MPLFQYPLHHFDPGEVDVFKRGLKTPRITEQISCGSLAGKRAIKIRGRAHDDNTAEVDKMVDGATEERFKRGVILLLCGAIYARSICEKLGGVFKSLAKDSAAEIDVRCCRVARNNPRRLTSGGVGRGCSIVSAVSFGGGRVVQLCGFGEFDCNVAESLIDLEYLCSI